jgi:hypothetical protein
MTSHERTVMSVAPEECKEQWAQTFPNEVITAINGLLTATGYQEKHVFRPEQVRTALGAIGLDTTTIIRNGYMNFEPIYQAAGWDVQYVDATPGSDTASMEYVFTPQKKA